MDPNKSFTKEELNSCIIVKPARPKNEKERLEELYRFQILNTPNEVPFDRITRMCARIFHVPIAIITLIDEDIGWAKSCFGDVQRQGERDLSFCSHTILEDKCLVVEDATQDQRFKCNPYVTNDAAHVRFYAGIPLITSGGYALGSLCIIDRTPRRFEPDELSTLQDLARIVTETMETRLATITERYNSDLRQFNYGRTIEDVKKLYRAVNLFSEGFIVWDRFQQVTFVNDTFVKITGYEKRDRLKHFDFWTCPQTQPESIIKLQRLFGSREEGSVEMICAKKDKTLYKCLIRIKPIMDENLVLLNYFGYFSDVSNMICNK